ncbi:MAG: insulinase family protein [Phycisphaeraceae bacterium]|nr:insulinase family protein [Phycisphaeraceae bacterium]
MLPRIVPLAAMVTLATLPVAAQSVPYERYQLDNGMTVILHQDRSLPLAALNLWYRVGSKDEPKGRSGFAHLFEHLMFMGTERVPDNQFDLIMESGGGSNNATTSYDRTNYFQSGPSSLLPTLLWLEADRLEDIGRMMTQEKLDLQRDVVRNERRQSYENAPYGRSYLIATQLMFPESHPYHIPTIGTHQDLEAATVHDVQDFFASFYVPSNISMSIVGDFDPEEIKPIIESLFADLPAGAPTPGKIAPPARLDRVVRYTTLDKVQLPLISIWYHSPAIYTDGNAEVDLLAQILTDGKSSRLYKRLVMDEGIAAEVEAYQDSNLLGSVLALNVYAMPDADLGRLETLIDEEISTLLESGPSPDELERFKASRELEMLGSMQDVLSRADALNAYQFYFGEPDSFKRDLDRYRNATPESVRRWAAQVLTPDARLIGRILPETPDRLPSARDSQPDEPAGSPWMPPSPDSFALSNGITVLHFHKPSIPLVYITTLFAPGAPIDDPARPGLTTLAADMLDEGAADLDAIGFADAVSSLGATFDAAASVETAHASMTVIKRNADRAIPLLADALIRPSLQPEDWARVRTLHIENLRQQDDNPQIVAARVANRALFGDSSPYGRPLSGTRQSVESISIENVTSKVHQIFRPEHATILIAGDITRDEARQALERAFGVWTVPAAEPLPKSPIADADSPSGLKVLLVDRPGAVQTVVRFAMPAPPYDSPARAVNTMINTLFGGSFTSRLNQNLRERNGYTYGARSSISPFRTRGMLTAGAAIRADATGPAVAEFLKEFDALRNATIDQSELAKSRETVKADLVESYQGLAGLLANATRPLAVGMSYEAIAKDLLELDTITVDAINKAAARAVDLDRAVLVLVGDKTLILNQLEGLKLPTPIEVDVHGAPASR